MIGIYSSSIVPRLSILDNGSLMPIFIASNPMLVTIHQEKRMTEFAVEDGTTRSDHVVMELIEIEFDFLLTDSTRAAYNEMYQKFQSNDLVAVQTHVAIIEDMMLISLPSTEGVGYGTSIDMPVRLREWVEVTPERGVLPQASVESPQQSSTVERGQVRDGGEASSSQEAQKGSILSGWF